MDLSWRAQDQVVLNDGINSAFRPDQIGTAQAAWGVNVTIRDGKPRTRDYKFIQRATLPKGMLQGYGYFSVQNGSFVLSIWGQLWRVLTKRLRARITRLQYVKFACPWACARVQSVSRSRHSLAPLCSSAPLPSPAISQASLITTHSAACLSLARPSAHTRHTASSNPTTTRTPV